MKKAIAIVLSALLISAFLVSCNDTEEISSIDSSDSFNESSNNVDESKEQSEEESSEPEPISPEYMTVISTGCAYTSSEAAPTQYEDSYGAELTDGLFAPTEGVGYSNVKLSGYAPANGSFEVVIDLGKEYDNIHSFAGSFLLSRQAGVAPPSTVSVKTSVDGETWERAGLLKSVSFTEGTMGVYTLHAKQYITARYVKFTISKGGAWVFLDELMVYADIPADTSSSIVISENVKKLYVNENSGYAEALESLRSGITPDYSLSKVLISKDRRYTISGTILDRYPDDKKLTDGQIGDYYESGTWVGFDGSSDVEIVIPLSSNSKDIQSISLNTFAAHSSKIYLPSCVTFALSSDGKEYTEIGRVYSPLNYGNGAFSFALELDKCVAGKYVKVTAKGSGEGTTMFIDEAGVYAYRKADNQNAPYYPDPEFPDEGKINYFDPSEEDYDSEQNLILGLGQSVVPGTVLTMADASNNTSHKSNLLTDGKLSNTMDIHDGKYFKSNSGVKRSIIYDLGASCSVYEFSSVFLDRQEWAVYAPGQVGIELSQDAENWYLAGYIINETSPISQVFDHKLVLDKPVQARYVRFSYQVHTWAGCSELRVIGKKNASDAIKLADSGFEKVKTPINAGYQAPKEDLIKGAGNVSLMYHSTSYNYTEDIFMPYLAYIDESGNMKDTMFDGFLFLLSGKFPSGVAQHLNSVKTDWQWELAQIYKNGQNAMALESAAAKAKQALGLPDDYKYKYYISIYYPRKETTKFGDVDGDGVSEDCSKFEDRQKVIEWYLDLALDYDKKAGFKNIELGGFYWFHEAVESSDDSHELINMIANETKERGYDLFWIPYYCSNGVAEWADYGFATACMQPNYVFKLETPLSNVKNAADVIKRLGMCLEMEISTDCLSKPEFYKRYIEYLKGGVYYGYMKDCIHMYYQEMEIYYRACNSKNAMTRSIYDYTYQFIKGTLDIYPDTVDTINCETAAGTEYHGKLGSGKTAPMSNYKVALSPAHGTVTAEPDGSFTYYPDKGFTGTDSFEYQYTEGLDYSESCKVVITVK